jgi:hypothetical protein
MSRERQWGIPPDLGKTHKDGRFLFGHFAKK